MPRWQALQDKAEEQHASINQKLHPFYVRQRTSTSMYIQFARSYVGYYNKRRQLKNLTLVRAKTALLKYQDVFNS
jgi:hypothetical protein